MKKKIALILMLCIIITMLTGCFSSYGEASTPTYKDFGGYFTILKEWYADDMGHCKILYANDTHVMYFYFDGAYTSGITPLYNPDGTLQIWEGE